MNGASIKTVFDREFMGYFRTPVAYVFLVVFIVSSIGLTWFVGHIFDRNQATMDSFFFFIPWVYLFLVPAVGMRLWAEERRSGTWELLFTLPVRVSEAVIGKFLAAWAFLTIAILSTFTLPLSIGYLGDPDWNLIVTGYLGCILMAGAYLGICSLSSALTRSQVISFVISVVVCMVLVFMGWSVFNAFLNSLHLPAYITDLITSIGFIPHFDPMKLGLIRLQDLGFFLTVIVVTLSLNVLILKR